MPTTEPQALFNLEAEQALLGALMIDNALMGKVRRLIKPEDFYEPLHRRLYKCILDRSEAGKVATPVTMRPLFLHDPAMVELGGQGYLGRLTESGAGLLYTQDLAKEIGDLALRRHLYRKLLSVLEKVADPGTPFGDVASEVSAIRPEYDGKSLPIVRISDLAGEDVPAARWVLKDWLPMNAVTLLAGGGGTGKSLFAQGLLSAISLGIAYLGLEPVEAMPTMLVNCEDSADEMHRRALNIARALGVSMNALGDMHCVSLVGRAGNELGNFDDCGHFRASQLFHNLLSAAKDRGVRVIALDNVGHLFNGNENVRGEVTQFINACNLLAMEINGCVMLLGHPAKTFESRYSGSTAWENAVRARWHLERPKADPLDPRDMRVLTLEKANGAAIGKKIEMVWHNGAFVSLSDVSVNSEDLNAGAYGLANERFLACLDACTSQRRHVSHNPRAGNFAPRVFSRMTEGQGTSERQFAEAMERLLHLKKIALDMPRPWKDSARRDAQGIARCNKGAA